MRAILASGVIYGPLILFVALCYGPFHHFSWTLVALVPVLILQTVLTVALAYLLALFAAALRDTLQLLSFVLSVGIYLSPVFFPVSMFPTDWRWTLWLNPMTAPVLAYQEVLLKGEWPPAQLWYGMLIWVVLVLLALGPVLRHSRDQFIDWL